MADERLNKDNGYIWRIVHKDNLPWHLDNGIHCKNSAIFNPHFKEIGNAELIQRRASRVIPIAPGGTLADYVPFYFTPFSPMMYNIYTGRGGVSKQQNSDILILVSSLPHLLKQQIPFIFTDRHAYTQLARYFNDIAHIGEIDWHLLQTRNFSKNGSDPEQFERYQAEALVHRLMPINALRAVICYTDAVKEQVQKQINAHDVSLPVYARKGWYFE